MNPPFELENFEISSVVGRGTVGVIYKAVDTRIKQTVAIKVIRKELLQTSATDAPEAQPGGTFPAEVVNGRTLKHTNIVRVFEFGETPDYYYVVMEFVAGRSLAELLSEGRQFRVNEVCEVMNQILEALAHAHSKGVIHGGLKPLNIMVDDTDQVQLSAFGTASLSGSGLSSLTGSAVGSPAYLAPEQWITGEPVDQRADIFSAGIIFYHMLTGQHPFRGRSTEESIKKLCTANPIPPSTFAPALPKAFDRVTLKALHKDTDERYQHAWEFAQDLRNIAATLRGSRPERHADRWRLFLLAGSIMAGASLAWFLAERNVEQNNVETTISSATPEPEQVPRADLAPHLKRITGKFSCLHVEAVPSDKDAAVVRGFIVPEDLERLRSELAQDPPLARLHAELRPLAWPYCELADLLAPYKRGDKWEFADDRNVRHYVDGDPLQLNFTVPDYDAHIYADYYQLDGNVVHLYPASPNQSQPQVRNSSITIGGTTDGGPEWQIQAPFGTEMIVIMAANEPLFATQRQEQEAAKDYLTALRPSLSDSSRHRITADYYLIITQPKNAQSTKS